MAYHHRVLVVGILRGQVIISSLPDTVKYNMTMLAEAVNGMAFGSGLNQKLVLDNDVSRQPGLAKK